MIGYHLEREGSFEIGRPGSREWKNFGRRWRRGLGGLENWTIFLDIICVSSLSRGIDTCLTEGNQSSTLLEYFQHYSKNIIVIFKRNQFIGFDDHSKTRRQILFKALSTKRIVKIFPTGRINIFRENWAKLNPKYITINRRLKIAIFEDPLPRKPTKGNSYAPRSKITWGCRNKGTFEEGCCQGRNIGQRSICQHNISAPHERENFSTKSEEFKPSSSLSRI